MSAERRTDAPGRDELEDAVPALPSCAATEEELQRQRERMRSLGPIVSHFHALADRVTIEFSPGFDRQLLDETLALERECCPFFHFDLDEEARRLDVTVGAEHRAALDALVEPSAWGRPVRLDTRAKAKREGAPRRGPRDSARSSVRLFRTCAWRWFRTSTAI